MAKRTNQGKKGRDQGHAFSIQRIWGLEASGPELQKIEDEDLR